MFSNKELVFAQQFPFSQAAKRVLMENSFSLEKTPESVIKRAALMCSASAKGEQYIQEHLSNSPELLVQEIQAFPVVKIFLSAINRFDLFDRFAELIANSAFFYLTNAKKREEALLELANDLNVKFELHSGELFFVRISVMDFLQAGFKEDFMKLVNQPVENGMVFLPENDFARFLSEIAREKIRESLPADIKGVPKTLLDISRQLKEQLVFRQKKAFSMAFAGKASPTAFPPCIAKLYDDLVEGKNVNHAGRFNVTTFLVAIGMPAEQIINLFRKTPNFSEKLSRYQVKRIAGNGKPKYASSSCTKMRSYGLCNAHCQVSHPLQFYEKELKNKLKEKTSVASEK